MQLPERVGEHLDLDVARTLQVFFGQHLVVAEGADRLALARRQRGLEIVRVFDHAHALAAAAGRGLQQHRVADLVGLRVEEIGVLLFAVIAGHQRHVGLFHQRLGGGLGTHRAHRRSRRPNEYQARCGAGVGEVGVLGQEAVAGMDGLRAGGQRHGDDFFAAQIAFLGGRRADQDRFVADRDVLGVGVRLGIHGDGFDAHAARGGGDAAGDFAAVGDQNFSEHGLSLCSW